MTSTTPLLAAVMIVKNESQHLARCLNSVRAVCDEIVIVDTGSTDDTVSIAESFDARVYHRVWNDDFAAARNESLEHTNAEWVLYIDADEMLVNVDVTQVRTMLTKANEVAAFGLQVSPMIGWLPYTDFRLWRHDPEIRFVGDIHETTLPDIRRLAEQRGQILQPIPLHMQHFGYEGDQTQKHLRNLPLLERQRQQTPQKVNILGQIARIHFELGNHHDAELVWQEALNIIRRDGQKEITDVTIFPTYADYLMNKGIDAKDIILEGQRLEPEYRVLLFSSAKNHLRMGRFEEALRDAEELLLYGSQNPTDSRFAYNKNMFMLWPQQIAADALFKIERYAESRFAYGNCVALGTPYESVRHLIRQCENSLWGDVASNDVAPHGLIDLLDATFLIPLRIDSGDRLRNIIATCHWLTTHFSTHILVGNAEPEKIRELLPKSIKVIKIHDNPRHPFHLTRAFNELARHVNTPILIHYDADVVFPPSQIRDAVQHVRTNPKEITLPYSYWHDITKDEIDGFLNEPTSAHARFGYPRSMGEPVGGCVVQNTDEFFRMGMDNEHFIGWASEDQERIDRAIKLGATLRRIDGPLFHCEHDRVSERPENRQFHAAGEAERQRLEKLTIEELRAEIASWQWTNTHSDFSIASDDLTITIPLRVESADRLRNAIVCTNTLLSSTTSRIIVGVHNPDELRQYFDPRIEIVRIEDNPEDLFHRTKILNELSRHVETKFFANLDCDVFVSPQQWSDALHLLRNESADMVYPYAGHMVEIPHAYFPWLENADFSAMPTTLRSLMHSDSVGGCVIWRTHSYFECGMENENFVSWGFEDNERFSRASTLGLKIRRVDGCVFHLHHSRGVDSTPNHSMIQHNEHEYERIRSLGADELRLEIQQWPWRHGATSR